MDITDSTLTRFWAKVNKTDDCWVWTARRNSKGYGAFRFNRTIWIAHRFSWAIHNGSIPDGLCVLHKCDNPPCVNPSHLRLGSIADNSADMVSRNRSLVGETNHKAKVTASQVIEIRRLYAAGEATQQKLADMHGVHCSQIGNIVRRVSWKHI